MCCIQIYCEVFIQVGSYNYEDTEIIFEDLYIAEVSDVKSVLDYSVTIQELPENQKTYTVDKTGLNYSVAGFKMTLNLKG